jgi:aspartate racemase
MKKIGIIAGIGPESSIVYYRLIIKAFQKKLKTNASPEIVMFSIDMKRVLDYVLNDKLQELTDFLARRVKVLEKAGVDYGLMASNTAHLVIDKLENKVQIPLINIIKETFTEINKSKIKKMGLFATMPTITKGIYGKYAEQYDVEIVIPDDEELNFIHSIYINELIYNRIIPETKQRLMAIAKGLQKKYGIKGLILGGTEFCLILNQSDFDELKVFDTTMIHVDSIVSKMIEN